jgi:hypothetical protein
MSRPPLRGLVAAAALVLLATSCSGSDGDGDAGDGEPTAASSSSGSDAETVASGGVTFEVPSGFSTVDADDIADDEDFEERYGDIVADLGVTTDQFRAQLSTVDVFLFDDGGPENGFLDNVNAIAQDGGTAPDDDEIQSAYGQMGAELGEIRHPDSPVGEVVDVDYTLPVQDTDVAGRAILVTTDDGVVTITVSTGEREAADALGDGILDSLAEAS